MNCSPRRIPEADRLAFDLREARQSEDRCRNALALAVLRRQTAEAAYAAYRDTLDAAASRTILPLGVHRIDADTAESTEEKGKGKGKGKE